MKYDNKYDENNLTKEINQKKNAVDKLYSKISNITELNSKFDMNNSESFKIETITEIEKKNKSSKNNIGDIVENKFTVASLKDINEIIEVHKKSFFVIRDELREDEEEESSIKMKRDIIVDMLMTDKNLIYDQLTATNFEERILSNIYTSLSHDSRKILIEDINEEDNPFNNFIKFDKSINLPNLKVTNDLIMDLCNNFIKLEELSRNKDNKNNSDITNIEQENEDKSIKVDSINEIDYKDYSSIPVEVKKEVDIELAPPDEPLDMEIIKFFKEFLEKHENNQIKDKVEIIFKLLDEEHDGSKLTNKVKNEILRSLKEEYLAELAEKIEETKKPLPTNQSSRIEIKKKVENPFKKSLESPVEIKKPQQGKIKNIIEDKIIYTNKGWGLSSNNKPVNSKNNPKPTSTRYNNQKINKIPNKKKDNVWGDESDDNFEWVNL